MYNPSLEGRNRDRYDIIHDIISSISKSPRGALLKSHIMTKAGLSRDQTNEYLELLIERGFLESFHEKTSKITREFYRTTDKALKFIGIYEEDILPLLTLLE